MKILYCLNSAQPGGMEQHVLDLASGMVEKGHEVYVWCPNGPLVEQFKNAGARVTQIKIKLECDPIYIFKLINFLRKNKIDVVHAHEIKAVANAMFGSFLAGTKVRISHTHTPISEWQVPVLKKIPNLIIQWGVVNLFSSKEIALTNTRKKVKVKEGISERKLHIIPNGIEIKDFEYSHEEKSKFRQEILSRYNIPNDSYIFGVVSRISEEKGHKVLLNSFKDIYKGTNFYLILAGGGPLEQEIKNIVNKYKLEDRVIVTGRFSAEDHKKYFCTFDCFVHPTLAEGFGIVLIEAMSAKLPLVASDLEVLKEVGGETVTYFETGDSEDLKEKLLDVYKNKDKLEQRVQNAYSRVLNNYTLEKFIDSYEKLYFSLLK